MSKIPAVLVRVQRRPILAILYVQDETFYVVEVVAKGGTKYALGSKAKGGLNWVIKPTSDKTSLWEEMKKVWDVTIRR